MTKNSGESFACERGSRSAIRERCEGLPLAPVGALAEVSVVPVVEYGALAPVEGTALARGPDREGVRRTAPASGIQGVRANSGQ